MNKDEALRLALEYVELVPDDRYNADHIDRDALITAIKAALEAKDEPVAWWIPKHKAPDMVSKVRWSDECEPLYTTPPQRTWVGLTREEILEARWHNKSSYRFARVLETKLKERNT